MSMQLKIVRIKSRAVLTMTIFLSCLCVFTTQVWGKYSGGSGEPNDPYRIATPEDLNDIGKYEEDWDKHFILINDVNLAEYTGTQFNIIGRWIDWHDPNNKPFVGVFDGNDCKIWNFRWDSNGISGVGLFGFVGSSGHIKNIGMENVDVNAVNGNFIGGLVGKNDGGTITDCYSTGRVLGTQDSIGGLVGENDYGTITDCYSTGSVSGNYCVGGLVGFNSGMIINCYSSGNVIGDWYVGGLVGENRGTITDCYSTGSVSGNYCVGGLVGCNYFYYATITDCYSTGNVSGGIASGGLVGFNWLGTITNCYSTGSVSGSDNVGGLVGRNYEGTVAASFWDMQTSGQTNSAGGIGKRTAEMKTKSTFTDAGWDFVEIWSIGENQTYPFLRNEPAGDLNHDKKVDLLDLAIFASHWLEGK